MNPKQFSTDGRSLSAHPEARKAVPPKEEALSLAIKDSLTGLANDRFLAQVINNEIQRSIRTGQPFVIVLLDLDGLKNINDNCGQATGSQAL
jgi:GGDEF domain-containing protein